MFNFRHVALIDGMIIDNHILFQNYLKFHKRFFKRLLSN